MKMHVKILQGHVLTCPCCAAVNMNTVLIKLTGEMDARIVVQEKDASTNRLADVIKHHIDLDFIKGLEGC